MTFSNISRIGLSSLDNEFRVAAYRYAINKRISIFIFFVNALKRLFISLIPYPLVISLSRGSFSNSRLFSFFASALLLLFMWPFILILFALSSLAHKSSGIFVQNRIGNFGRSFKCLKITSMLKPSPWSNSNQLSSAITCSTNSRISPFGSFIRKYKLDELPQLVNIFNGDMDFVGFRPDVPSEVDIIPEGDRYMLFSGRAGLTSIASLLFSSEEYLLTKQTTRFLWHEFFRLKTSINIVYSKKRSLLFDIYVIMADTTVCSKKIGSSFL